AAQCSARNRLNRKARKKNTKKQRKKSVELFLKPRRRQISNRRAKLRRNRKRKKRKRFNEKPPTIRKSRVRRRWWARFCNRRGNRCRRRRGDFSKNVSVMILVRSACIAMPARRNQLERCTPRRTRWGVPSSLTTAGLRRTPKLAAVCLPTS